MRNCSRSLDVSNPDAFPFKGRKRAIATYQLIAYEQHRQDGSGAHCSRLGHDFTTRLRTEQHRQRAGKKSTPLGILKIPDNNFDAAFEEICGSWLNNGLAGWPRARAAPVLACGMIGSRQGWLEAPYVPCPASLDHLAQKFVSLTTKKGRRVASVPRVSTENSAGVPDVIGGEETQIIGALTPARMQSLFVLRGTHSKWVRVKKIETLNLRPS